MELPQPGLRVILPMTLSKSEKIGLEEYLDDRRIQASVWGEKEGPTGAEVTWPRSASVAASSLKPLAATTL